MNPPLQIMETLRYPHRPRQRESRIGAWANLEQAPDQADESETNVPASEISDDVASTTDRLLTD
ncbi:hypothetical protein C5Y97_30755 [Blastopirellula marina]|uniref:Uncharacterized protein n=1 Tax=Blastopirellula marina TaxID=124 RepID=A0A2S8F2Z2_9BACT|nr:hypothetical protein C5Y98_30740 [Blastopirellula marina]PQO44942.1 hypothetical protein C5Y93_15480 [Blastopirellula marina]PTL40832.1 hypothetical protein C5Y97_30755 [Blastopirellula marina]